MATSDTAITYNTRTQAVVRGTRRVTRITQTQEGDRKLLCGYRGSLGTAASIADAEMRPTPNARAKRYRASENVRNNLMRLMLNAGSLSSVCGAQEAADHGDVAAK